MHDLLTLDSLGVRSDPRTSGEWAAWVSPAMTRRFCLHDTLLDWLDLYGCERGFVPDDELPGYNYQLDFSRWVMEKGIAFEAAVLDLLEHKAPMQRIARGSWEEIRSLDRASETLSAMQDGVPLIAQAVLRDPERRLYGGPDLLVRSDILNKFFPESLGEGDGDLPAPLLGTRWHYRVVDIKYTTLHLSKTGCASSAALPYMAQVALYNSMLGRLQGYEPPDAYLLGRGWQQGDHRARNCLERLARVPMDWQGRGAAQGLKGTVAESLAWARRVRSEGQTWTLEPQPSVPELWPNLKNQRRQPWQTATRQIATQLADISQLWFVGQRLHAAARANGLTRWTDPACSATALGLTGEHLVSTLDALLAVNREPFGPPVRPARVRAVEEEWRAIPDLEFYVDFETVNGLDDDFSRLPEQNGQPLIFTAGCGHLEAGEWVFRSFTVDDLSEEAEARMLDAWFDHLFQVRERLAPGIDPKCIHWSPAETSTLETAYNAARVRHPERDWPALNWFDFLGRVVKAEPVVVRGAMAFGLKVIAKALHKHGLIETTWEDNSIDGLGAMVAAWRCQERLAITGGSLADLPLMREVVRYNEVDCRVMMEAVSYLRRHH